MKPKEPTQALLFIKSKHNGEIPYKYGPRECAKLMEAYAKQKIEEIRNELYEIMPTGKTNVSDMIDATVKAFRVIDEHLKQQ